jgi:hypothetical protein
MFCISLIILSKGLGKTLRNWIKIGIAGSKVHSKERLLPGKKLKWNQS